MAMNASPGSSCEAAAGRAPHPEVGQATATVAAALPDDALLARPVRRNDWMRHPLDERWRSVPLSMPLSAEELRRIRLGFFPREMEDKWFVYCEPPWIHLHRSWTGY